MRKRRLNYARIVTAALLMALLVAGGLYLYGKNQAGHLGHRELNVLMNEIAMEGKYTKEMEAAVWGLVNTDNGSEAVGAAAMSGGVLLGSTLLLLIYFYIRIIRPFRQMEEFADEVARGNLDLPLRMERQNLFGSFTWAFDCMREELKAAREREARAIEKNRTMIATISHDIKTPVAGIRAYCEGLEQALDSTMERRQRYLKVIMKKCDEVTGLTNDLFLSAIHDMERLNVDAKSVPLRKIFREIGQMLGRETLDISEEIPDTPIMADTARLLQIMENLIGNARKYAQGTPIHVRFMEEDKVLVCEVFDTGEGIPEEDMPFVLQKFYRGKNGLNQPGAGLGLYICKTLMEQMGGSLSLENQEGLHVYLKFCIPPDI